MIFYNGKTWNTNEKYPSEKGTPILKSQIHQKKGTLQFLSRLDSIPSYLFLHFTPVHVNFEMVFWCLQFLPKKERKQVKLRFHSSKVKFVRLFFGGNVCLKKSFRLFLTFPPSQWREHYKFFAAHPRFGAFLKVFKTSQSDLVPLLLSQAFSLLDKAKNRCL